MKRRIALIFFLLLLVFSIVYPVSAAVEWNAKYVDKFSIPLGNIVPNADFSDGLNGWNLRYDYWPQIAKIDTNNYLTGNSSAFFEIKDSNQLGTIWMDADVDPEKTYKLGFVVKTEDISVSPRFRVFFKDIFGSWVDLDTAKASLPEDYFKGLIASGIGFWTASSTTADSDNGPKFLNGTHDWYNIEFVLDLPTFGQDFQAGFGKIISLQIEIDVLYATGKIWVDSIYLYPID